MAEGGFQFRTPVQCSEDLPPGQAGDHSFQTGVVFSSAGVQRPGAGAQQPGAGAQQPGAGAQRPSAGAQQQAAGGAAGGAVPMDLETDAVKVDANPPRAHHTQDNVSFGGRDNITIQGRNAKITATGLAGALQPGVIFQLGAENHMTIGQGHSSVRQPQYIRTKKPVTTSTAEPAPKQLDLVSEHLGGDWRRLGRHFGFTDGELDQLRMDFYTEGQHEINYRMLLRWKQKDGRPMLKTLAQALADIGRGDLADRLA